MDSTEQIELSYKEDFRVACLINNLSYKDLLQYFIDHISFYVFIGGSLPAAYVWSTAVCIACREDSGGRAKPVQNQQIQQISLKYIKVLTAFIQAAEKRGAVADIDAVMEQWSREMLPLTHDAKEITLAGTGTIWISFDCNLLCNLSGINVKDLLQYFINHVSLARERAINLLQHVEDDPSTAVLLSLMRSYSSSASKILPYQEIYKAYGLRLLKLDKKQKEEINPEIRLLNYSAFYLEWYHALNTEK